MISQKRNEVLSKTLAYFMLILSPFAVIYTIAKDDLLCYYLRYVSFICILLTIGCCLVNISDAIKLRRKKSVPKKKIHNLTDFELDFEDDRITGEKIIFGDFRCIPPAVRNMIQFSKGRDNYALILNFGICFTVASVAILISIKLNLLEYKHLQDDICCSAIMLLCQGLALTISCLVLTNLPESCYRSAKENYSYKPFDKTIKVPMRVIVARTIAVFLDDRINVIKLALGFTIFSVGIYFCRAVPETPQISIKWRKTIEMHNIYHFLVGLICFVTFSGIVLVVHVLYSTYRRAKQNLLALIEQNWQRNLHAIQFLLPDQKTTTLEQLIYHLNVKSSKNLTGKEREAVTYIGLPMWKWKKALAVDRST